MMKRNGTLRYSVLFFAGCIFFILIPLLTFAGVGTTKHNLSVSGPGEIKAISETEICIFCHTPHNSNPAAPLWNHEVTAFQNYVNYWSPSLKAYLSEAEAPPIDGFSRLCLSCHDGTIALGSTTGREGSERDITMVTVPGIVEAGTLRPGTAGYLGTDLSGGHPISFIYDETLVMLRNTETDLLRLNWPIRKLGDRIPIGDPDVKIYPTQSGFGVQCTSCHDPHGGKGGAGAPPFWRKTTYDEVCLVCHIP
jgi:hypothetical protein